MVTRCAAADVLPGSGSAHPSFRYTSSSVIQRVLVGAT